MSRMQRVGGCLLTGQQKLLLRAALLSGHDALNAWENWVADINIDTIDPGSYRLLPLLYHNLRGHGIDHPLMDRLKGLHRYTWYKNHLLFKHMGVLIRSFENAGIKTLLLKGAALTLRYYKDYGLRPMADFDIMVSIEQAPAAISRLLESNWTSSLLPCPEKYIKDYISIFMHAEHFIDASGFDLDLHWHLLPNRLERDADNDFWNGAVPIQIDGVPTSALNSTDELLHVCVHGGMWRNSLPSIRWVADSIMILNNTSEIDWDRLLLQVQKRHLVLPMRETLSYLHEEYDAPIPEMVLQTLQSWQETTGERLEYNALTCQEELRDPFSIFWMHFSQYSRLKNNAGLIARLLGFLHYLRLIWRINYIWQVPFYAFYKFMHRVWLNASWYKNKLVA